MSEDARIENALFEYAEMFRANPRIELAAFALQHRELSLRVLLPRLVELDLQLRRLPASPADVARCCQDLLLHNRTLQQAFEAEGPPTTTSLTHDSTVHLPPNEIRHSSQPLEHVPADWPELERFRIEKELGRGAFGTVFLARDSILERQVAVKVSHQSLASPEKYLREAKLLALLDHPGIVPVYDVMRLTSGQFALLTKFVDGGTLEAYLQSRRLNFSQTARILAEIADTLHYAHSKGIFHRDLKPANVLLNEQQSPFLADFGMALSMEEMSNQGGYAGTLSYMSPEQARGDSGLVDGRSDIFSLGVMLYEMLTGRRPFTGSTNDLLDRIKRQEAIPPRSLDANIPRQLEQICLRALAKNMADRYITALDLAADLRACITYSPQPLDVSDVQLPESLADLEEQLAENNHDVWAEQRISEGWEYGDVRDDIRKSHPDLVPYAELTESEKDYDRRTVERTLKAIIKLGYTIVKVERQAP